ncbi:MAG: ATP-binding protein [Planctomycetes bacterium]|nr:ATP-binding protein [Planctomycetota bacterium]
MIARRRVPLSRLWGLSLLAASTALLGATWFLSGDPDVSAQVQALEDARTLADQLEEESVRLVRRVATGQIALSGRPIKIRFGEEGALLEPRPVPQGVELVDVLKDLEQPRPTPASLLLREAEGHGQRQEWALALEDISRGERVILEGEDATYARLMLQKARALSSMDRHREAARVLEALWVRTRSYDFYEGLSLRVLLGHSIAAHWKDAGSPNASRAALNMLLEELLAGKVPLQPNRLSFEGRLLLQTLQRNELASQLEGVVAGVRLAEQLREPLRSPSVSAFPMGARVAFFDRSSGVGMVTDDYVLEQLLRERFTEALPPSGTFQVRSSRGGEDRSVALRLVFPPGLPDDWWLVLVDSNAYTEPAVRRRFLLLSGMLAVVSALVVVGFWGARALRRRAELEQIRSDFIAGVSHELRTPAASLALLASNLMDGRVQDPKRLREYYAAMQRDAVRLQRLVADVLDVSHLERGSFKVEPVPTDVAALLLPLAEDQRLRLSDAGLELSVEIAADLPEVSLDPAAAERAVANLLENARKYASNGGWVELRVQSGQGPRGEDELHIEVADNGPGVPEAWRERIFEPYERGKAEGGLKAGAGLGLALVRETMLAHGGRAELVTCSGQQGLTGGACFRLSYPVLFGEKEQ